MTTINIGNSPPFKRKTNCVPRELARAQKNLSPVKLPAITYQYNAQSDGVKRCYTNDDELKAYGNRGILNPELVTYYRLLINGVLQPKEYYEITEGMLYLKTADVPPKGAPIVLDFVTLLPTDILHWGKGKGSGILPWGCGTMDTSRDLSLQYGMLSSQISIEKQGLSGPTSLYQGEIGRWEYTLEITNRGNQPVLGLTIYEHFPLDEILHCTYSDPPLGTVTLGEQVLHWEIDRLQPGEQVLLTITLQGCFLSTGKGTVGLTYTSEQGEKGPLRLNPVAGPEVEVHPGIAVEITLVTGPEEIPPSLRGNWQIQMKVVNLSGVTASELMITCITPLQGAQLGPPLCCSQGKITPRDQGFTWHLAPLSPKGMALASIQLGGAFPVEGYQSLLLPQGTGKLGASGVTLLFQEDQGVRVLSPGRCQREGLEVKKELFPPGQGVFIGQWTSWHLTLSITNLRKSPLHNVTLVETILLDTWQQLHWHPPSQGQVSLSSNTLLWHIDTLLPGEGVSFSYEMQGTFHQRGLRPISRTLCTSVGPHCSPLTSSGYVGDPQIQVMDPLKDFKPTTIITEKVFSQCQHRTVLRDVSLPMEPSCIRSITFQKGKLLPHSLRITPIPHRPAFRRVRFLMEIPYILKSIKGETISGTLPSFSVDVVLFCPTQEAVTPLKLKVDTHTQVLSNPLEDVGGNREDWGKYLLGVVLLLAWVGRIHLSLPAFHGELIPPSAESFKSWVCREQAFPIRSPKKPLCLSPSPTASSVQGMLRVEEIILQGPFTLEGPGVYQWQMEIRVRNLSCSPLYHTVIESCLSLGQIQSLEVLSLSQGTYALEEQRLLWNLGTLQGGMVEKLKLQIRIYLPLGIKGENPQYHFISDGHTTRFLSAEALPPGNSPPIPAPSAITYHHLYINGVLQPQESYEIESGVLILKEEILPPPGIPLTLEIFCLYNPKGQLLKGENQLYLTLAADQRTYFESPQEKAIAPGVIPSPSQVSFQKLYINGVLQPPVNYSIAPHSLTLITADIPLPASPITLESVSIYGDLMVEPPICEEGQKS